MSNSALVAALAFLILLAGLVLTYIKNNQIVYLPPSEGGVACTMEAKICPDGSAVGRTGPNCEFAECPSTVLR